MAYESNDAILEHLDTRYLMSTLSSLARVPTDVPLGYETLMEPDDPKLVHYVQNVLRPELINLGYFDLIDAPGNNLIVRVGNEDSGRSLLIQNYTPAQHQNLMDEPFSGRIANARAYGVDEPAVFGQGVSQNKAHQAVMLAVLKLLREREVNLNGRLYWAINNEGKSSHWCSEAILKTLAEKPSFGLIQIGTGLKLSLGNRGRVDIDIHVRGKESHSSVPSEGLSAIEGANEVINRLKNLEWADQHPILGGRHAVVYKIRFEPVAPHTLPSDAFMAIDRRLLPGDDVDQATEEVREVLGDMSPFNMTAERGVYMLPALVDSDDPGVQALQSANSSVRGQEAETVYGQGTFDAGGLCALGVPTVMYGASGAIGITGTDFVTLSSIETEARVLTEFIADFLG